MRDIDLSKPLSSAVEGMMAMKYESDSAQGGNILTRLPATFLYHRIGGSLLNDVLPMYLQNDNKTIL